MNGTTHTHTYTHTVTYAHAVFLCLYVPSQAHLHEGVHLLCCLQNTLLQTNSHNVCTGLWVQQDMASPSKSKGYAVFFGIGHSKACWGICSSSVAKQRQVRACRNTNRTHINPSSSLKHWNRIRLIAHVRIECEEERLLQGHPDSPACTPLTVVSSVTTAMSDTKLLDGRKHMDCKTIDSGQQKHKALPCCIMDSLSCSSFCFVHNLPHFILSGYNHLLSSQNKYIKATEKLTRTRVYLCC